MGRTRRARGPGCRQRISSRDPSSRIRLRSTIRVIRAANWSRVTASEAHAESEESGRAARRASQAACASRMSSTRPPVARRVGPHLDQRRVLTAVPVGTRDLGDGSDEAHVRSSHHQHEITRGCRIGQLAQGDWIAPKHGTNTTIHAVYSSAMSTAHALLGLLEPAPRHGYALKRMFDRYFAPDRPLAFGQVYATLGLVGSRHDDVAVPLEAAEGGVHLAEGERPVGREVAVEHALEGVAVAWGGLEQAEQCVGGGHCGTIHCMYSRVRPMFWGETPAYQTRVWPQHECSAHRSTSQHECKAGAERPTTRPTSSEHLLCSGPRSPTAGFVVLLLLCQQTLSRSLTTHGCLPPRAASAHLSCIDHLTQCGWPPTLVSSG